MLLALTAGIQIHAANANAQQSDPDAWIAANAGFQMQVADTAVDLAGLRVMVGNNDMTPLFQQIAPGVLAYQANGIPLPAGEQQVSVYQRTSDPENNADESLLHETHIRVLTESGFEESEFTPSLSVQINGQLDESHSGSAPAPERSHYQDMELSAGFTARQKRGDLEIKSSANLQGVSQRQQALRFGELGSEAPKYDLSDYRIALSNISGEREYGVELGHISFGEHPLLLDGVSNRGISGRVKLSERIDLAASMMNGSSIVGWDNPFGLDEKNHRIAAVSGGIEFIAERPGAARLELLYTQASIANQDDFGIGEISDAEKSDGFGLVLKTESEDGLFRGQLNWASAKYENPVDPFLDQGFGSQPVTATRNQAEQLTLSYQLLDNWSFADESDRNPDDPYAVSEWASNLTLDYRYERADALYQTVGGNAQPDQRIHQIDLNGNIGLIAISANHQRSEDNLDNLASILKTRTRISGVSLSLPLRDIFSDSDNLDAEADDASDAPAIDWNRLIPNLDIGYNETHQFGVNQPVDFAASHVPDQFNDDWSLALNWAGERWDLGLNLTRGEQDNRQPGRTTADFANVTREISVNLRPTDELDMGLSHSFGDAYDAEQNLSQYSDAWGVNLNWRNSSGWSYAGNYSLSNNHDSQALSESREWSGSSQLNFDFELPADGRKLPGNFFLNHSFNQLSSLDRTFAVNDLGASWTIQFGINVTIY